MGLATECVFCTYPKQRNAFVDFFGSQGHVRDCTAPPVFHMRGHSYRALVDVVMAAAATAAAAAVVLTVAGIAAAAAVAVVLTVAGIPAALA